MTERETQKYALEKLNAAGIDQASCTLSTGTKYEMNVESGKMTLIRTVFNNNLILSVIKEQCHGSYHTNKLDQQSVDQAVAEAVDIAESSEPDPAYAIAEYQPAAEFKSGHSEPDSDMMYDRLDEFLTNVKSIYPKIMLENSYFSFSHNSTYKANTNGVDFKTTQGIYNFSSTFSASDEEQSSSFNYTGFSAEDIKQELLNYGSLNELLRQSCEQISPKSLPGKFVGDVIISPDCLDSLINYLINITISTGALISDTSVYKDKLDQQVADPKFTLRSRPTSDKIAGGYFVTNDGYAAQDSTIIDQGVLKTFLLNLYGANKTGLKRAVNDGGYYIVEPGTKSFAQLVGQVERGILLARYSGGNPVSNGDFSGVAKNSYYIENGKIQYPITETMVAGNLIDALTKIIDISQEQINFGHGVYPWLGVSGITISGK